MTRSNRTAHLGRWVLVDVALILLISLVGAAAHFSIKQGQAVISGDAAQYVDGAEALLTEGKTPNLAFRKSGYTLLLAGLGSWTGNMSWSAVSANHVFLVFAGLAAYGLGLNLRSRTAGWVAAILVMARVQAAPWAERLMSEDFYVFLLSFGVLFLAVGLSRGARGRWMFLAGLFLGAAWLTRAVAVTVIAAGVVCVVWELRSAPRRALVSCLCLLFPVTAAVLLECGLNRAFSGSFRTSTGSLGVILTTRARYFQGVTFADTDSRRRLLELLPERRPEDAYLVNKLDGCVARAHAIREHGMDEWTFSRLIGRAGLEAIAANPRVYVSACLDVFVRHLLRRSGDPPLERLPPARRRPIIVHPQATESMDSQDYWYAYWFLPHRSVEESVDLVSRMRSAAGERAPFGRAEVLAPLRYWSMLPPVVDTFDVLRAVAGLWPGFALILCGALGLNRRTCMFLAVAYVFEAMLIGAIGSTDLANTRYQYVWLAIDTALVAVIVAPGVQLVLASMPHVLASMVHRRGRQAGPAALNKPI